MSESPVRTVVDRLHFAEGPRWHDGALWFSDMHAHQVLRTDLHGNVTVVAELPFDEPSGLGWLPDGRLLVVAMETQQLMRLEPDGRLMTHADLSGIARGSINDMIVRSDGTAYVGDTGARLHDVGPRVPGQTIGVTPDGRVWCAADDLRSPNGHLLSPDESTLIVAESGGACLTAFAVASDGTLGARRSFAALTPVAGQTFAPPDGICLDADGAVWVAEVMGRRLIRVLEGGTITDTLQIDGVTPFACVLGGPERRTLLACMAPDWRRDVVRHTTDAFIAAFDVAVPGAGAP